MRMLPGLVVSCIVIAGTAAATTGCDDTSLGHLKDPAGPPRLIKAMIQDAAFVGGPPAERGAAVDLLDTAPAPSCSDTNPCINQFLVAQTVPPLDCSSPTGGTCVDPLAVPADGVPLNAGATAIRLVFNKLLDSSIETVAVNDNGAPTGATPYKLAAGIVELLDSTGTAVAGTTAYWDNSGSPEFTSDVVWIPFGPAIVILPGNLDPEATYTIRIHPELLKDRQGLAAADASGATLVDPTDLKFTTEAIATNDGLSYPDFTSSPTTIAPNEVLQFAFWSLLDETSATVTATGPAGFDPTAVEAYADRGADPTACADDENDAQLDFVYTTGAGAARVPADWPAGDYTLSFTVKDAAGKTTYTSPTMMFTVAGADGDPASDANTFDNHVTPEQCQ
jgi:hypothetical protein